MTEHVRVLAYPVDDEERQWLENNTDPMRTESAFVVLQLDRDSLSELEAGGISFEELHEPVPATEPTTQSLSPSGPMRTEGPGTFVVTMDFPFRTDALTALSESGVKILERLTAGQLRVALAEGVSIETGGHVLAVDPDEATVLQFGAGGRSRTSGGDDEDEGDEEPGMQSMEGQHEDDQVSWDALLIDSAGLEEILDYIEEHGGEVVADSGRRIRFTAPNDLAGQVLARAHVAAVNQFVGRRFHNSNAAELVGLTMTVTDGDPPPFDGSGEIVGIADSGVMEQHEDFEGRIVTVEALGRDVGDDPSGHGTHVVGSVAGNGAASDGKNAGMAPGARIFVQSLLDDSGGLGGLPLELADLFESAYDKGVRIHNNSWGSSTDSRYTIDCHEVDEFVHEHRDMLVVFSAGNDGSAADPANAEKGFVDWLSIGSPAAAKNCLTVGAQRSSGEEGGRAQKAFGDVWPRKFPEEPIADELVAGDAESLAGFSSRGPTDDRRIKPDIVAPGSNILSTRSAGAPIDQFWGSYASEDPKYAYLGGTSMAAPIAAGAAALVRQFHRTRRGDTISAALLKATLVNGTRWLSGADATADHEKRPNYHQGFGALYLPTTIPGFRDGISEIAGVDAWADSDLRIGTTGDVREFELEVSKEQPLRITMAYTDLPGRGLQNDLSLIVRGPDGSKFLGNRNVPQGMNIPDPDNNVETIGIKDPAAGIYTIRIIGRTLMGQKQDYALVASGDIAAEFTVVDGSK